MKKTITLCLSALFIGMTVYGQSPCTPGNATTCPDPENNGQICPDSFPAVYVNVPYHVEATILPPPTVVQGSITVPIYQIVLKSVDNLPPGLSYATNVSNNTFLPGTYYCVAIDGTPTTAGVYPLKIVVDAYIDFLGSPVYVGEQVDSTSLAITVLASPAGLSAPETEIARVIKPQPNPFRQATSLGIDTRQPGLYELHILSITGQQVYSEQAMMPAGEHYFSFTGDDLKPGLYLYGIVSDALHLTGKLIKH